mmetsp:Transcript_104890/g.168896  ORF Transcript_104890/g.168896 Transcript_104890/m.168896 type:complete len:218 (-) Transcript_104890:90-743(-)
MFAITLERFFRFRLRLFSHLLQLTGKGVALTPQQLHSFFKRREALLQRRPLLVTLFQHFGFSGTVGLGSLHGCLGFFHLFCSHNIALLVTFDAGLLRHQAIFDFLRVLVTVFQLLPKGFDIFFERKLLLHDALSIVKQIGLLRLQRLNCSRHFSRFRICIGENLELSFKSPNALFLLFYLDLKQLLLFDILLDVFAFARERLVQLRRRLLHLQYLHS